MLSTLRSTLLWRGILAVLVGIASIAWPGITVGAFVVLWAVYAFLAAGADLTAAFRADRAGPVAGHLLLALLAVAAGVAALVWPGLTAVVLTLFVAGWALATGVVEIVMAFRRGATAGERAMWSLTGIAAVALAVALVLRPDVGALSLATVFGLYCLFSGFTLLGLSGQVRAAERTAGRLASAH